MLHYNRTDLSVGIDIVKSNNCKEYLLCHYWIFNYEFEFQSSACNRYHDLKMLCLNLSDIAIITVNVLFIVLLRITLANLKQPIYYKTLCLKIVKIWLSSSK